MLSIFVILTVTPSIVYSCGPGSSGGTTGRADEFNVKFTNVKELPLDFVLYRNTTDINAFAKTPKDKTDALRNMKSRLQDMLHVAFRDTYDPSYEAGLASFDVESPKYQPLDCDHINYLNAMPALTGGSATIPAGKVCLLSPALNSVIKVCPYVANTTEITTNCRAVNSNENYLTLEDKYLTFDETVKISVQDDYSGAKVQKIRSGFKTYKTAIENRILQLLSSYCNGAFRAAEVSVDYK